MPSPETWPLVAAFGLVGLLALTLIHSRTLVRRAAAQARALEDAERHYGRIVQSVHAVVWRGHPETHAYSFVSGEAETLFGHPPKDWVSESGFWSAHLHPDDRERATLEYRSASSGDPVALEYRFQASDGRWVWVRDVLQVVDEGGRLAAYGVMLDITDRKAAEDRIALQASVIEQAHEAIMTFDEDQRISGWNRGAERLFEVSAADAHGRRFEEILPYTYVHPEIQQLAEQRRLQGLPHEAEFKVRLPGGQSVHITSTISTLQDAAGHARGLVVISRDIGPQKRVEHELRSRARQQAAVAALGQRALAGIDLSLVLDQAVALVSHTLDTPLAALFELDAEADVLTLRTGAGWPEGVAGTARLSASRGSHAGLLLLSGRPLLVENLQQDARVGTDALLVEHGVTSLVAVVVHGARHPFGMLAAYATELREFSRDDVHFLQAVANVIGESIDRRRAADEQRRLEAQMTHVQKLESLGVLAGGIAHDFNNLLVGIMGHAGLALMDLPSDSPAVARIRHIETAAQRASELTNQMLAYSGRGRFVVQPLDLSRLVEEMGHLLHTAISKNATLSFDCARGLPPIQGDPSQLRQVVMNLMTNASDALAEGAGTIRIRTGLVHAERDFFRHTYLSEDLRPGDYVFVEVSDTGCGMTQDTLSRIFDPFFTTKFTGRGLGLAAVLGIVRGHRGAMRIDSTPDAGTTFQVYFPAATMPALVGNPPVPGAALPAWQGRGTVLVIDDEEGVRDVARSVLERVGLTVRVAADGQEGVEAFLADPRGIDLVLLDMTMPRLNGAGVLTQIRRVRQDLPVILSTGFGEEDTIAGMREQGRVDFIQKPYGPSALIELVRSLLAPALLSPRPDTHAPGEVAQ
ncbi:MAG: PAS domain S-box protein [Vicinamibacterales bacterium]